MYVETERHWRDLVTIEQFRKEYPRYPTIDVSFSCHPEMSTSISTVFLSVVIAIHIVIRSYSGPSHQRGQNAEKLHRRHEHVHEPLALLGEPGHVRAAPVPAVPGRWPAPPGGGHTREPRPRHHHPEGLSKGRLNLSLCFKVVERNFLIASLKVPQKVILSKLSGVCVYLMCP